MKKYTIVFIALFCFTTVAQSEEVQAEIVPKTCTEKRIEFSIIKTQMRTAQNSIELLYMEFRIRLEDINIIRDDSLGKIVLSLIGVNAVNVQATEYLLDQEGKRLQKECPI